jgi:hypothetical protein
MTASARILDHFSKANGSEPIRILGASGQLGYGVPTPAFSAGLERKPHLIGCDMGSIDIGPYYLGSGELATALAATRRDLRKVLLGALKLKIPLIIGSAGSAGAKPHLEQTLAIIREVAREEGLSFRMGVLRADIERAVLKVALRSNGVVPIDGMPMLDATEVDAAANIVGQMGMSAFQRALAAGVDVVVAGRACDTAIFAALPAVAGFPIGPAQHMAKIIECASLCCVPGGRDNSKAWRRNAVRRRCRWRRTASTSRAIRSPCRNRKVGSILRALRIMPSTTGAHASSARSGRRSESHGSRSRGRGMWGSARSCSAALPIPASSRAMSNFCEKSKAWCAILSAKMGPKITCSPGGSTG